MKAMILMFSLESNMMQRLRAIDFLSMTLHNRRTEKNADLMFAL